MSAFAAALAAFRLRSPAEVQAEADAMIARMLGPLDEVLGQIDAEVASMHADGTLPDRRRRTQPIAHPDRRRAAW